ncbi:MAG TPA: type 2 lanthipeptide synthetase LanM family protein [Chloroflexia bacterium]|nr:type 2 lanthipeptide synthetase LanM family protein [Chloroflexia bacterium]
MSQTLPERAQEHTSQPSAFINFENPAWYLALDLSERLALRRARSGGQASTPAGAVKNYEAGQKKLDLWKKQNPFNRDLSLFADRLASLDLSENDLLEWLSAPVEETQKDLDQTPDWLEQLAAAFENFQPQQGIPAVPEGAPDSQHDNAILGLIAPLVQQSVTRLRNEIAELERRYGALPFDPTTMVRMFLPGLARQSIPKLSRTLALEVNIARLEGRLEGETTEVRFQNFLVQLGQPEKLAAFFNEYPVLARQLVNAANNWLHANLTFLRHLCADWQTLRAEFSPESEPGQLVSFEGGVGDVHRQGQSVLRLTFSNGLRLVYKPRSLALDAHFQALLAWLNDQPEVLPFRIVKIIDRGEYGWSEFVSPAECENRMQVEGFYHRQGAYLALLHVLQATDFHSENLIASGEHPVMIDMEALFHGHLDNLVDKTANPALTELYQSVMRVGLLPERMFANTKAISPDASGLGGQAGQLSPRAIKRWEGFGTDEMRVVHKQVPLEGADNRPRLDGVEANVEDYLDEVVTGFEEMYRLLVKKREELLAGPLQAFKDDQTRIIVRPTITYNSILRLSFHPDLLHNALDRDRHLDYLWAVKNRPFLRRLLAAERTDLLNGDIPLFTSRVNDHNVYSSRGEVITDYFRESAWETATRRVRQMGEIDLQRQVWFIKAAFATIPMTTAEWRRSNLQPPAGIASRERLLEQAQAVASRLSDLAIVEDDRAGWIGLNMLDDQHWQPEVAGFDLYSGSSGIALFLAYHGHVTGDATSTKLARMAVNSLRRQITGYLNQNEALLPGVFDGLASPVYLYTHLSVLWNEPGLLDEATELAYKLGQAIEQDKTYDLLSGSAGALIALLNLYKLRPDAELLRLAVKCGEHLLKEAYPTPEGLGWLNTAIAGEPLTGFSHGAAGIAWALAQLAEITADERYSQAIKAALQYERSQYVAEQQNWRDLRRINTERPAGEAEVFHTNWCHGAPGIALSRLALAGYLKDPSFDREIEAALSTTLREGFGYNHSLCHGDLGNLEPLLLATQNRPSSLYQERLAKITAMISESIEREGWCTGIPLGVESPGLMCGIAGIGYGLLRLASPEQVPGLLLLAPPIITDDGR